MKSLSYVYKLNISGYVIFQGVCTTTTHLLPPPICRQQHPNPPCFFASALIRERNLPDILNRAQWFFNHLNDTTDRQQRPFTGPITSRATKDLCSKCRMFSSVQGWIQHDLVKEGGGGYSSSA